MSQNFLSCDRDEALLLPADLWDWLPGGHLARFVLEAIEEWGDKDGDGFVEYQRKSERGISSRRIKSCATLNGVITSR